MVIYPFHDFVDINITSVMHDDVIKWGHFPRYWPFVRGIHQSPVNSPRKGQWRGAMICVWINGRLNNREAGDLRRYRAHYDVIVMGNTCNDNVVPYGISQITLEQRPFLTPPRCHHWNLITSHWLESIIYHLNGVRSIHVGESSPSVYSKK